MKSKELSPSESMAQDFHREIWCHMSIVKLISSDHWWHFAQLISVFIFLGAYFPCQEGLVVLGMFGALIPDEVTERKAVHTHELH